MHGHVLVALLKAVVLADVVQVITADDDRALHLHLGHHACAGDRTAETQGAGGSHLMGAGEASKGTGRDQCGTW